MPTNKRRIETTPTPPTNAELARHLGRRLRYLRAQLGITQAELAQRAATDRGHLSRTEAGKSLPHFATLARLASPLGVGLAELVRGIPAPKSDPAHRTNVGKKPHQSP